MIIMSYIAYPTDKGKSKLISDLNSIKGCEVEASENEDIVILVTMAEDKEDQERIQNELSYLSSLSCTALVYAGNEEDLTI